jgi:hypothetical protein
MAIENPYFTRFLDCAVVVEAEKGFLPLLSEVGPLDTPLPRQDLDQAIGALRALAVLLGQNDGQL